MKKTSPISGYEMISVQMLYSGAAAGLIYPSFLIRSTEGAYWILIAAWIAGAMLSSWLYSKMLGMLENNMLIDQLKAAVGQIWTIIVCLPVLLVLLNVLIIMLRAYSEIVTMTMLPTTPLAFLNSMLIAPALLALAGFMPIVRTAKVFFMITLLFTLSLQLSGLSDVDWTLGSPLLRTNGDFLIDKRFYAVSFLWMGFVPMSLIGPYTRQTARSCWKSYSLALLFSFPVIAGYIYLPVMTFGREMSQRLTFPFVSKMDSIYKYWIFFENLTSIFVSISLLYVLFILALMFHALGETCKALMPRINNGIVYIIIFIIVYSTATIMPTWRELEQIALYTVGLRLYTMFIFPLFGIATLLLAKRHNCRGNEI